MMIRQDRAVATRNQIIVGAAEEFGATGFEGTRLDRIVERSGTTRGALYFHFRTKGDLATAVIEEHHRILIGLVEAISASGVPAVEQIVMLSHEIASQSIEHPIVRACIRLTLETAFTDGLVEPYVGWISACESFIRQAIDEGDVNAKVVPVDLARLIIASITGIQIVSRFFRGNQDLTRRVDDMWAQLLPRVMPPARRRKIERVRSARLLTHQFTPDYAHVTSVAGLS